MIPTHQDDVIGVPPMMANEEPVELTSVQAGIEKPLDGPVTAAFAGPAGQASHGHPTAHGQHRLDHPTQLAQRGGLNALA
jgi:hypothetical protein